MIGVTNVANVAHKYSRRITWAIRILSAAAAALLLCSALGYPMEQQRNASFALRDGWVLASGGGEAAADVSLPMKTDSKSPEIMDFYCTLPDKVYPVEALTLTVFQKSVWIYVGDELLYQYEFLPTALHRNDPGDSKIVVTLPADAAGKEMHIRYRRDNPADVSYIQPPQIIDGAVTKAPLSSAEVMVLASMSIILFIGLLLTVKFLLQARTPNRNNSDLFLALLFFAIGIWVLAYSRLIDQIGVNRVLTHTLEYLSFYSIPYALWSYISESWNVRSKAVRVLRGGMGAFLSLAIGAKVLFQADFVALLGCFHILLVVNIALLMRELLHGFADRPPSYKLFAVGMWLNIAAVILALVQQYLLRGQLYLSAFFVAALMLGSVFQVLSVLCLASEGMNMRFHTTFMQNLNNEYSRYETIFCNVGDVFADWDREKDTAYLSYNFEAYFGVSYQRHSFADFFHSTVKRLSICGDIPAAVKRISGGSSGHERLECSFSHPQDGTKWFSLDLFSGLNSDGQETHIIGIIKDITEQKRLQSEYALQMQFNHISQQMYSNVLEADMTRNLLTGENCKKLTALLGMGDNLAYDDAIRAIQTKLTHPDYKAAYGRALSRDRILSLFENGVTGFEHETYELDENNVYQWLHLNVQIYRSDLTHTVCIISYVRNRTEEKQKEISLIEHSQRDSLSGLLNKEAARLAADRRLRSSAPEAVHALFMLDIDHFKSVNDSVGHMAGDGVIADAAAQIKACFREYDILGRFGGDEFVVLMCDIKTVSAVEQKCLQLINEVQPFCQSGEDRRRITLSIGVALFPASATSYEALCEQADRALYASKSKGRNTYTIYS